MLEGTITLGEVTKMDSIAASPVIVNFLSLETISIAFVRRMIGPWTPREACAH